MKKLPSLFLILLFALLLGACGEEQGSYLHGERYGAEFRKENDNLFPNPECVHRIDEVGADGVLPPEEAELYHMVVCKYPNCDYEPQYEPHTLYLYEPYFRGYPQYAENGYLYHTPHVYCYECSRVIGVRILCLTQDVNCGREGEVLSKETNCLLGVNWEEIFREYPYELLIREETAAPSPIP